MRKDKYNRRRCPGCWGRGAIGSSQLVMPGYQRRIKSGPKATWKVCPYCNGRGYIILDAI